MRKNVASQVVGAQINSRTDGSPVTSGTTTVYVTGDGGTQATGSVGSGAATHEGHGFWTYTPSQAETNYNHVAFTFENSSGVNQTVQAWPVAYDPGDSVRLGLTALPNATAGANGGLPTGNASGQVAVASIANDAITAAAIAADAIGSSELAASAVTEIQSGLMTSAGYTAPDNAGIAAIKAKTDNLPVAPAATGDAMTLASGAITAAVVATGAIDADALAPDAVTEIQSGLATAASLATVAGYIDTEVAAIKAQTDLIPVAPAAVGDIPTANQNADALLDRADAIETGWTVRKLLRIIGAALGGEVAISGATVTIRDIADAKTRITATTDADGQRTAVTLDAT